MQLKALWAAITATLAGYSCMHQPAKKDFALGRFQDVRLTTPSTTPEKLLLILAPASQRSFVLDSFVDTLANSGTATAVVNVSRYARPAASRRCYDFGDDLATLARALAFEMKTPGLPPPVVLSTSQANAWGLAAMEQAPPGTFVGYLRGEAEKAPPDLPAPPASCETMARSRVSKLSHVELRKFDRSPAAAGTSFEVTLPMRINSGLAGTDEILGLAVRTIREMLHRIYDAVAKPAYMEHVSRARLERLDLLEFGGDPAAKAEEMVIMFSGDGGWADFTNEIADAFVRTGRPVVGVNLISYFWNPKSAEAVARDVESIYRVYSKKWRTEKFRLVGFSHGADILPFAVNRLASALRPSVSGVGLISPSRVTDFKFRFGSWFFDYDDGDPTAPELLSMIGKGVRPNCVYGTDETPTSLCTSRGLDKIRSFRLPGGHHMNGDVAGVVRSILAK